MGLHENGTSLSNFNVYITCRFFCVHFNQKSSAILFLYASSRMNGGDILSMLTIICMVLAGIIYSALDLYRFSLYLKDESETKDIATVMKKYVVNLVIYSVISFVLLAGLFYAFPLASDFIRSKEAMLVSAALAYIIASYSAIQKVCNSKRMSLSEKIFEWLLLLGKKRTERKLNVTVEESKEEVTAEEAEAKKNPNNSVADEA